MARFSIVFIFKKAIYKFLKPKKSWLINIPRKTQNIATITLNLKQKKLNVGF